MKEIYIIAQTIKTGGGKELLEYLLEYLDTNYPNVLVKVYVDKSFSIKSTCTRKVIVVVSTLKNVSLFFKRFENAIYFGNLPPVRKVNNSALYFHNRYLLMSFTELFKLKNSKLINKLKNLLRELQIKIFVNNIDFVACQNKKVQEQFSEKYKYNNVEILPFFRSCPQTLKKMEKKFDFCYAST